MSKPRTHTAGSREGPAVFVCWVRPTVAIDLRLCLTARRPMGPGTTATATADFPPASERENFAWRARSLVSRAIQGVMGVRPSVRRATVFGHQWA